MPDLFSLFRFYFYLDLRHWEIALSLNHVDGISVFVVKSTFHWHKKTVVQKEKPFFVKISSNKI